MNRYVLAKRDGEMPSKVVDVWLRRNPADQSIQLMASIPESVGCLLTIHVNGQVTRGTQLSQALGNAFELDDHGRIRWDPPSGGGTVP